MSSGIYELILESYNANGIYSSILQTDSILIEVVAVEECQARKFTFKKRSISLSYRIDFGSMQTQLPEVTQTPPVCKRKVELVIRV